MIYSIYTACPELKWGYNCSQTCNNCVNGSAGCLPHSGCIECNNPAWMGSNCDIDVDECLINDTCGAHSKCENSPGTYQCVCDCGYKSITKDSCTGKG